MKHLFVLKNISNANNYWIHSLICPFFLIFQASNDLSSGTVANAWHFIAEEMATTAETHKTMAALMAEDLVKPLRAFADSQHKSRKNIEGNVDKTARSLLGIWILLRKFWFQI